jgi:hypothetical protein
MDERLRFVTRLLKGEKMVGPRRKSLAAPNTKVA